jgi:hypothetical protein
VFAVEAAGNDAQPTKVEFHGKRLVVDL